jgi:hypothetical protein
MEPLMSKYEALAQFLKSRRKERIPMTFGGKRNVGCRLPRGSYDLRFADHGVGDRSSRVARAFAFAVTPEKWFSRILELPGTAVAGLSPRVLIASSFLPGKPPRDPADRIIAATARDLGATLITRDSLLLNYGKQGHLNVVAC